MTNKSGSSLAGQPRNIDKLAKWAVYSNRISRVEAIVFANVSMIRIVLEVLRKAWQGAVLGFFISEQLINSFKASRIYGIFPPLGKQICQQDHKSNKHQQQQ